MREGFKETFILLIESQDSVKKRIDKKQDAMIKQLQKNQLAITDNLNRNRLAITEGFDKMDEVKRFRSDHKNNTIKYTHNKGVSWQTITFTDGMYSYSDTNDYIHQYMAQKNHHSTDSSGNKQFHINLTFILSTYRVLLSFDDSDNYHVDLRNTNFGDLIGFEKKIVTMTEYGTKLPNITNSIDVLKINTSAMTDNIVNGINANTIAVIPTDGQSHKVFSIYI